MDGKQCHVQKMWLGEQTEFPKCMGGEGVYDVLTLQKSGAGARALLGGGGGGGKGPPPAPQPKCSPDGM